MGGLNEKGGCRKHPPFVCGYSYSEKLIFSAFIMPGAHLTTVGAKTTATILINLMRMLSEGPDVSLNGSPTVSPTTAAL